MSSITVIKVREGSFVSRECLEESLEQLGLIDYVNIVQNQKGVFQLAYDRKVRNKETGSIHEKLTTDLKKLIARITPIYTEKFATLELEKKGFHVKSRKQVGTEVQILMERTKPLSKVGLLEKYKITIHQNNRVTLDAINFSGRTCLTVSNKLERKLGSVVKRDFKPEAQIHVSRSSIISGERHLRI